MGELQRSLDRLLSLLPLNGNKTLVGAMLKLVLPLAVAKFPPLLVAAPIVEGLAEVLIGAGLMHKGVKAVKAKREKK